MKVLKRITAMLLTFCAALFLLCAGVSAKTGTAGQTVETVLFYVKNSAGEDILVSRIPISEMEADIAAGKIDVTNHNYSVLDRYVTTVHQEAKGFTAPDFVAYAQSKSGLDSLKSLKLTFAGEDRLAFWEIDQTGYDETDTYSCSDLYGTARYNFPLLYEYWNYQTQDYYDPAGVMSRDEVVDYIFAHGEPETVVLSVLAFSQRYMTTDGKYGTGDYNMEDLWQNSGVLDTQRAIRLMVPMTKEELYGKTSTASNTRYWNANLLLDMENDPDIASLGSVAAPTANMTEDADNYYIAFDCATEGAAILYNHNYVSPSYTPSCEYTGGSVVIPKSAFPGGTVTMTCRAVKEGYTDAGVQTLTLTSSGAYEGEQGWTNPYSDVAEDAWYARAVEYAASAGLLSGTGAGMFSPEAPMTRLMLAEALYRLAGSPAAGESPFADCNAVSVAWCYENGVVNGISETAFAPDESVTREQIAAMMMRYTALSGSTDERGDLTAFSDAADISDWARSAAAWAVGRKLLNGMGDGTLAPRGAATRAQAAQILMNLERSQ